MKKTAMELPFGTARELPARAGRPAGDGEPLAPPGPPGAVRGRGARQAGPGPAPVAGRRRRRRRRAPPAEPAASAGSRGQAAAASPTPATRCTCTSPATPWPASPAWRSSTCPTTRSSSSRCWTTTSPPGWCARTSSTGRSSCSAGQGVRPRRRRRHVGRQRQPGRADVLGQGLPVRQPTAGRRSTARASRGHRHPVRRRRAAHLLGRAAGHAGRRSTTARSG